MKTFVSGNGESGLAASVAPEDLQCGDFVAVLSVVDEYPSFFWLRDGKMSPREDPVRVQRIDSEGGAPLKIKAICLPFVLVKDCLGKHRTLDVRLCQLARLSSDYARKVRKTLKKNKAQVDRVRQ